MRPIQTGLVAALAVVPFCALPAESLGVLAVAPPPGPSPELVEITVQLRQVIAERSPGVLDARQLRDRMSGQVAGASLSELDRAFEGARAAHLVGDYEGSVRTLRAVIEELEKLPESEDAFKQWTRAVTRLAKEVGDLGRADEARGLLERLVRAAPDIKVDTALYPPKFVRQVDEVRAQLKALPARRLAVTSPSKGVRVYVNGRDVGTAPVTVALARGRYRVSGAQGTLRTPPIQVELAEGDESLTLDFAVAEALRPSLGPGLALPDADRARRIVAAGGFLGLDSVLATSIVEEGGVSFLDGALYDARRGMLKREGRVRLSNKALPLGGTTALADFLVTGQASSALVEIPGATGPTVDLKPPPPGPRPIDLRPAPAPEKSKALGWVAFGTGIATLGFGGVAIWQAVSSSSSYDKASKLLDASGNLPPGTSPAQYNQYLSDGDSAKRLALITGIGSGVCLVTTGVLGYLAYKQTGEVGPFRF